MLFLATKPVIVTRKIPARVPP